MMAISEHRIDCRLEAWWFERGSAGERANAIGWGAAVWYAGTRAVTCHVRDPVIAFRGVRMTAASGALRCVRA